MKKVMHIIHGLSTGGAETLVKDYALKIDKTLFDIEIVCLNFLNSPYEKLLEDNGIKVTYLLNENYSYTTLASKIISKIKICYKLKKVIHKKQPDIIHTHLPINSLIKFAKPHKGTKIYHTVHTEPDVLWKKNKFHSKIDFYAAKWLVKKYGMQFIVLHNEMREKVNRIFKVSNSIILNNGIDFIRFNNAKAKSEVRKEFNIPNDYFVVGHVGRFGSTKNHHFLVDVFNQIHNKNRNSFLLLIGSGKEKEEIEKRLKELKLDNNYLILSNRLDIPDLLNAMDVFVFPSKHEGLGISLIEAQEMRLPCFISDRIPKSAIISNLVTVLSLEDNLSKWTNAILNYEYPKEIKLDDSDWNIQEIVYKLQDIYLGLYQ